MTQTNNLDYQHPFLKIAKKNVKIIIIDLETHLYNRFKHLMSEPAIPAEPTREQEISYLKYLVKSFNSDPIFTLHPRMTQASPHRLWYKNAFEYRKEYRKTFLKNFLLSDFFAWPLII